MTGKASALDSGGVFTPIPTLPPSRGKGFAPATAQNASSGRAITASAPASTLARRLAVSGRIWRMK